MNGLVTVMEWKNAFVLLMLENSAFLFFVCLVLEHPSRKYTFVCFGRLVSFLSLEKATQLWPLKKHT